MPFKFSGIFVFQVFLSFLTVCVCTGFSHKQTEICENNKYDVVAGMEILTLLLNMRVLGAR